MKDLITPKIGEARKAMFRLKFFMVLLDSIAVYIFFALILTLAGGDVYLAVVPSMLYLLVKWALVLRNDRTMNRITSRYPNLDQRLQTAYDNREESNIIVQRLLTEVSRKLDDIYSSAFFEKRAAAVRVFTIIALLFGLLTVNFINANQLSLDFQKEVLKKTGLVSGSSDEGNGNGGSLSMGDDKNMENSKRYSNPEEKQKIGGQGGGKDPGYSEGPIPGSGGGVGGQSGNDIYGESTSVRAEGQDVKMEVHPEYGGEIDIKTVGNTPAEAGNFKVPDEIESAGNPQQDPVQYEEVIRNYWGKMIKTQEGGK